MRHSPAPSISDNALPTEELQDKETNRTQTVSPWRGRLRGLRWRVMLEVLPSYPASVEELRRAAANGRRRYADLRRRLLVDPHIMDEVQKPHHLSMDNPLSQDPESVWGRYFRNAELERTIDKDLTRLYPEHGIFFQTPACQAMLRRILLVWSLIHPHYSYRQGMHELLAPLLYVLQVDVIHLLELKKRYEDLFDDRFDGPAFQENDVYGNEIQQIATSFLAQKTQFVSKGPRTRNDDEWFERVDPQDTAAVEPDEFGFSLRTMVLGSDTYGAEGELGALLSGRFVEHDAYCMFETLMSGQGGALAMADYFVTINGAGSTTGISLVLEASAALYRALAAADSSLHSHLIGLGVEPQFFALRWLRVLFGREFDLEKLLLLWDAIFSASNTALPFEESEDSIYNFKYSPRSAFILALAVSMLRYLRPMLLATPNATSCLQKLLNFPQTADVGSLIENAKMLQPLAEAAAMLEPAEISKSGWNLDQNRGGKLIRNGNVSPPIQGSVTVPKNKILQHRNSCSPELLRHSLPDSYWEQKWKNSVLQKLKPEEPNASQNKEKATLFDKKSSLLSHQDVISSQVNHVEELIDSEDQGTSFKVTPDVSYAGVADNGIITVRHELVGGHVEGVISESSNKNKNRDAFTSSSPASPQRLGVSEDVEVRKNVNDNDGCLSTLHMKLPSDEVLRGENFDCTGGNHHILPLPGNGGKDRVRVNGISRVTSTIVDTVDEANLASATPSICLQTEVMDNITQNRFQNELRRNSVEERAAPSCKAEEDGVPLMIDPDHQSSPHSVVLEDVPESSGNTSPLSKGKTSSSGSNAGRFFWMWNRRKSDLRDKRSGTVRLSKDETTSKGAAMLTTSSVDDSMTLNEERQLCNEESIGFTDVASHKTACTFVSNGSESGVTRDDEKQAALSHAITDELLEVSSNDSDTSGIPNEKGPSTSLRSLGQSMMANIQVLEVALSQGDQTLSKEGLHGVPMVPKEKSDHFFKTSLSGKGHMSALAALAELREISNILLQM